ncbi:hypothetical protein FACS189425_10690 [Clostridia bacterium]|nr:hypothetical protein FACS189425_10690 [Clostridia bacterium]
MVVRMCAVCRLRRDRNEFAHIIKNKKGEIVIAHSSEHHEGRGAYVCENCVDKAIKKRALNRAFKGEVPNGVYEELRGWFNGSSENKDA